MFKSLQYPPVMARFVLVLFETRSKPREQRHGPSCPWGTAKLGAPGSAAGRLPDIPHSPFHPSRSFLDSAASLRARTAADPGFVGLKLSHFGAAFQEKEYKIITTKCRCKSAYLE